MYEQKKEIVYIEKPGMLKESDLAAFEKRCDTLT